MTHHAPLTLSPAPTRRASALWSAITLARPRQKRATANLPLARAPPTARRPSASQQAAMRSPPPARRTPGGRRPERREFKSPPMTTTSSQRRSPFLREPRSAGRTWDSTTTPSTPTRSAGTRATCRPGRPTKQRSAAKGPSATTAGTTAARCKGRLSSAPALRLHRPGKARRGLPRGPARTRHRRAARRRHVAMTDGRSERLEHLPRRRWLGGRELDLLNHLENVAVGLPLAGDGSDHADDVFILEVVVAVEFDLGLRRQAAVAHQAGDFPVQGSKARSATAKGAIVHDDVLAGAVGAGPQANLDGGRQTGVRRAGSRRGQRHFDHEIPFLSRNLEREDKEAQELEHDINHRRHVDADLLVLASLDSYGHGAGDLVRKQLGVRSAVSFALLWREA